jgi:peroxiredoxin Q/BCP
MDQMNAAAPAPQRLDVKVNDRAPDFTVEMYPAGTFDLSDTTKNEVVVLYFYSADGTPVCTKQAEGFRDKLAEFRQYNAGVYGLSRDHHASHDLFARQYGLNFPLLVDEGGRVRLLFGMPGREDELVERATYVIDMDGLVRHIVVDADDAQRHIDEALEAVQRIAEEQPGGIMVSTGGRPQD